MDDNSDSRTATGWGEQEEELEAFGLSTLATAYGITAGECPIYTYVHVRGKMWPSLS